MVKRIGQGDRPLRRTFFREWREFRGLTQPQLAERLGTNKSGVSKMERGETLYNQSSLEAWAFALGCEPGDLISRSPTALPMISMQGLPEGDAQRVVEFIKALQVTHQPDPGEPSGPPPAAVGVKKSRQQSSKEKSA